MDGRSVLKIFTGFFLFVFVISSFAFISHKSYAAPNPYAIKSARVISANGEVEGNVLDINNDEIINNFKLHELNDSISLKVIFENTNSKEYIIKSITDDNENDCIEYKIEYIENQKVEADGTFEVIITLTYVNQLDNVENREIETPIKLTMVCSDDVEELNDTTLIPTPVVRISRSNRREVVPENYEEVLTELEGEVQKDEVINRTLTRLVNPKTNDSINLYLIALLVSAFGSAVCFILLTRDNKKALIGVTCIIFVVSAFIPMIVNAMDTAFNALLLKNPGLFDKLIITYTIDDEEKQMIVDYNSLLDLEAPEKEGYTFKGWIINKDNYLDTEEAIKEDISIEAEYVPNTYTIIYDKNNILATGSMSEQSLTYDKSEDLIKNKYVLTNYKFDGWNTLPDGTGASYENTQEVKNILKSGSITLYAQWKKIKTSSLITGPKLNTRMKELAGDSNTTAGANDVYIKEFKRTNSLPIQYNNTKYLISDNTTGDYPTYMWYEDGIIYYFSEADEIYLNKDSSYMFNRLVNIKSIDTSFNTSRVNKMDLMFYKCERLEDLDLSSFNTSNTTSLRSMFSECYVLKDFDFSSFDTSKVTNFSYMFNQCYALTELDISNFNTSSATNLSHMFSSAENLAKLDISHFNTSKVTAMDAIFSNMFALTELNIKNLNTSKVTNMAKMFMNAKSIKSIDLTTFDTTNVTNMSQMFDGCESLEELYISNFNTSKVTNMKRMFAKLYNMKELDISHFNTSKVTNMSEMFMEDISLTKLNLGNMNTSSATDISNMFRTCTLLPKLDVSSFNTTNVTNMKGVFNGMNNLESIDVTNFITNKVTNMQGMFSGLNKVKVLDVSSFNTANVTNMAWMFDKMFELETLYASDKFVTTKVTTGNQTFEYDSKLQGSNGTKYDKKNISYKYAHVDADDYPGYFTMK